MMKKVVTRFRYDLKFLSCSKAMLKGILGLVLFLAYGPKQDTIGRVCGLLAFM
jgi:hypothetical protein